MPNFSELKPYLEELDKQQRALLLAEEEVEKTRALFESNKKAFAKMVAAMNADGPQGDSVTLEFAKPPVLNPPPAATGSNYGALKRAVKSAIEHLHALSEFTSSDVFNLLKEWEGVADYGFNVDNNRANISSYMREFAEAGLVKIVTKGSGRRPTTYTTK